MTNAESAARAKAFSTKSLSAALL